MEVYCLSNVEANLTELLRVSKNIEKAIKSIQNTEYLITQKYKSLGLNWNDNRYKSTRPSDRRRS